MLRPRFFFHIWHLASHAGNLPIVSEPPTGTPVLFCNIWQAALVVIGTSRVGNLRKGPYFVREKEPVCNMDFECTKYLLYGPFLTILAIDLSYYSRVISGSEIGSRPAHPYPCMPKKGFAAITIRDWDLLRLCAPKLLCPPHYTIFFGYPSVYCVQRSSTMQGKYFDISQINMQIHIIIWFINPFFFRSQSKFTQGNIWLSCTESIIYKSIILRLKSRFCRMRRCRNVVPVWMYIQRSIPLYPVVYLV